MFIPQPIKRSRIRLLLGVQYYRVRRYLQWKKQEKRMAMKRQEESLPFVVYRHETPLLRQLSQVDMWMQRNKIINLRLASRCLD
ncbi:MAG: vancomycin resistance protein, partial [Clostridia bacterium]